MGVRPPQSDSGGSEPIEFGIPVLANRLASADLTYPVTGRAVVRHLDDPPIPVDAHGTTIRLSSAMAELDREEFDSRRDVLNALHPVFEERRASRADGLLGSIRALLPV